MEYRNKQKQAIWEIVSKYADLLRNLEETLETRDVSTVYTKAYELGIDLECDIGNLLDDLYIPEDC